MGKLMFWQFVFMFSASRTPAAAGILFTLLCPWNTRVADQTSLRYWSRLKYSPSPPPSPSISAACRSSFQLLFPSLRRTFTSFHFEDISQPCEISVESPSAPPRVHTPKKILSFWIGHKLGSGTFSVSMDQRHPRQTVANPLFLI